MTFLRSLVFNTLFYANLIGRMLLFSPIFAFGSEKRCWWVVKSWARSSLWLLDRVGGVHSRMGGTSNLPSGPFVVAAKHQSFWDVFALLPELDAPTFILKRELLSIPVFGWYAKRMAMIPVDRSARGGAVASMIEGAERAVAQNRQIVIYPEGTRTRPGAEPDYRRGVYRLYEALDLPVVPVALNSGLYWPRRGFLRKPGTIDAEFLEPIGPGLPRETFFDTLSGRIETRSEALLLRAFERDGHLPADAVAAKRVRAAAFDDARA